MKEDTNLQACRLCLSLAEDDTFSILDDIKKEMLAVILPELNLDISNNPIICRPCMENLQRSYDFKTEYLNYFYNLKTDKRDEDCVKCTVCYLSREKLCCVEENILLKEMLEKCLPEVTFTEQASVCEMCLEPLQNHFNFVTACLEVEEKLAAYNAKSGGDKENKINLFDVLESDSYKNGDNITESYFDLPLVPIKKENAHFYPSNSTENDKVYCILQSMQSCYNKRDSTASTCSNFEFISIKKENADSCETNSVEDIKVVGAKNIKNEFFIEEEEVEIKCDKDEEEKKIYKCDLCDYQTFRKTDLTLRHMLKHKKPGEVPMYKCSKCSYESKRRGDLNSHLATHNDSLSVYRCHLCHYKSIYKSRFEEHTLKHNLPEKYKCEHCTFKAAYKKSLVKHLRTHKRIVKKMYKCHLCPYETKRRTDLADKHMLIHRTPDEVIMYKCLHCDFQAKHKSSVIRHALKHKNPEEITMYKCPQCEFHTKQKRYLTTHELVHKNPEEVMIFKCDQCPYEAKHKAYLRKHKAIHRTADELGFCCNLCSYRTNTKSNLQRHLKRHKAKLMDAVLS